MNWLQFFASVIESIAWPVSLLVALWLLRNQLLPLIPNIGRLKYKNFEVEFREQIKELSSETKPKLTDEETPPSSDLEAANILYSLAEVSPRGAILEAWLRLESHAIMSLLARNKISKDEPPKVSPLQLAKLISTTNALKKDDLEIFHKLRELRNKAVHLTETSISQDDVAEYIDWMLYLNRQFRKSMHPARIADDR